MFTGIVEGTGIISDITSIEEGIRFRVTTEIDLSDSVIGDSIAVDGCCLTAVTIETHRFDVEASHETLAKTTLGEFTNGRVVNLERAMRVSDRFGGHIVQGHVDTTGRLKQIVSRGDATDLHFEFPDELKGYIVEKGSITIDGISLTVNGVDATSFHVTIIPHTGQVTTILDKAAGEAVNLETDILGKYIANILKERGLI